MVHTLFQYALGACSLVFYATSASAQTLEHKPIVGDYTFRGCYTEGDGVRAVTDAGVTIASYDYAEMTIEECASDCAGYKYWGVEYSGECYCGNTLAATSTLAPLSECSFICPGDSDEYCGAGNRLELYELSADIPSVVSSAIASSAIASSAMASSAMASSAIASSAIASSSSVLAPTPSPLAPCSYIGCYSEATNVRTFSGATYINYDLMSVEICAEFCTGFMYFGVEYGGECYCGNSFGEGSVIEPETDCNMPCDGTPAEFCGAGNRLNVYSGGSCGSVTTSSDIISSTALATSELPGAASSTAVPASSGLLGAVSSSDPGYASSTVFLLGAVSSSLPAAASSSLPGAASFTAVPTSSLLGAASSSLPGFASSTVLPLGAVSSSLPGAASSTAVPSSSGLLGAVSSTLPGAASSSDPGFASSTVLLGAVSSSLPGAATSSVPVASSTAVPASSDLLGAVSSSLPGAASSTAVPSSLGLLGAVSSTLPGAASSGDPGFASSTVLPLGAISSSLPGAASSSAPGVASSTIEPSSSGLLGAVSSSLPGAAISSVPVASSTAVPASSDLLGAVSSTLPGAASSSDPGFASSTVLPLGAVSSSLPGAASSTAVPSSSGLLGAVSSTLPGAASSGDPGFASSTVLPLGAVSSSLPGAASSTVVPTSTLAGAASSSPPGFSSSTVFLLEAASSSLPGFASSTALPTSSGLLGAASSSLPGYASSTVFLLGAASSSFPGFASSGTSSLAVPSISSTIASTSLTSSSTIAAYTGPPTPSTVPSVLDGKCVFVGCYTEATNSRALNDDTLVDYNEMTVEMCASFCSGYLLFGLEWRGECYCGDTLQPGSVLRPPTECDLTCDGAPLEFCGAGERLDVYFCGTPTVTAVASSSVAVVVIPTPSNVQSVGTYNYKGCYTEATNSRALTSSSWINYGTMTVNLCASFCGPEYSMFGVEYSGECYCGNVLETGSVQVDSSQCNMLCDGNNLQFCGGPGRLNLYSRVASAVSSSTLITSTISTPAPTPNLSTSTSSSIDGYTYFGCQTEGTDSRALLQKATAYNTMTLESCASDCAGYTYFGTEYGRECYCGNSFSAGSVAAPATDCNFPCAGNALETCGAGLRLSTYVLTDPPALPAIPAGPTNPPTVGVYNYFGCQTEGTFQRALTAHATAYDTMTLESCSADCAGYTYFGTEYGRECYCGDSFSAGSVPAPAGECDFLCAGDSLEYCGAGLRLTVYQIGI